MAFLKFSNERCVSDILGSEPTALAAESGNKSLLDLARHGWAVYPWWVRCRNRDLKKALDRGENILTNVLSFRKCICRIITSHPGFSCKHAKHLAYLGIIITSWCHC